MTAVTLKGDFRKLDRMIDRLADPSGVLTKVSKVMAEEAIDLVKDGYRTETDPYGKKWKPKKARDGRKTLSGKTGLLKGTWHHKLVDHNGFMIETGVDYGDHHQRPKRGPSGRLKRPRRKQVPDKGMPTKWGEALSGAAAEAIETIYR